MGDYEYPRTESINHITPKERARELSQIRQPQSLRNSAALRDSGCFPAQIKVTAAVHKPQVFFMRNFFSIKLAAHFPPIKSAARSTQPATTPQNTVIQYN